METAILSGVIKEILVSLGSFAYNEIARVHGVKDEIEKLEHSLASITQEIKDADRTIAHSEATNQRLKTLTDIAYEAEGIIDRFKIKMGMLGPSMLQVTNPTTESQTNCMRRMLSKLQELNGSSVCRPCRQVGTRHEAANDIERLNLRLEAMRAGELTQAIRELMARDQAAAQSNHIGPIHDVLGSTGSVISIDCDDHVKRLRAGSEALFAIVGAPGVGKTALARKIYRELRNHFSTRLWVHVSTVAGNLTIWSGDTMDRDASAGTIAQQMDEIRELLSRDDVSSLLLVIDNVRDDDGWGFLASRKMIFLAHSVRVLVTTPHPDVARRMGVNTRSCCHRVSALGEDDGWLLLHGMAHVQERHAVGNIQDPGRRIVRKCSGVPVALETVGCKLRFKDRVDHWEREHDTDLVVRYKEIRRSIDASYMELGYRLKRCFLYCALYPEGFVLEQHHLVQQWIAEGFFLDGSRRESTTRPQRDLEREARQCYRELVKRSLLQPVADNGADNGASATMPALLRSYAIYRSQDENYVGDPSNIGNAFKTWRVCVPDENAVRAIPEDVPNLVRTLMVLGGSSSPQGDADGARRSQLMDHICKKFTSLRVLDLRGTQVETVSDHLLERLLQLRYLNLSSTMITALPPEVGNLVVLQFLILKNCSCLTSLPTEVGRLSQLRCLDISETPVLRDIRFRVANLQELNCFRGFLPVGGWAFKDLSGHSKLTSLHILKIGSSSSTSWQEAAELRLNDKICLKDLELCCTPTTSVAEPLLENEDAEDVGLSSIARVFDALEPPQQLASLKLSNFYGVELPSWVSPAHLTGLKRLTLHGCSNTQRLPPLGQMRNLKVLAITGSNSLFEIGDELRGSYVYDEPAFPRLEQLSLARMRNLQTWSWGVQAGDMPLLRRFQISRCPKLSPLPPWLQHCTALTSFKAVRASAVKEVEDLPELKELELRSCRRLERVSNLGRLQDLKIAGCSKLRAVQGVPLLRSLRLHEHTAQLPKWLPPPLSLSLRRLEIVAGEKLLDKCSTGLAPYGHVIQDAADHVYGKKLDDGSVYFSYTRSTGQFQWSPRCRERAHRYSAVTVHVPPQKMHGNRRSEIRFILYSAVLIAFQCLVLWSWI